MQTTVGNAATTAFLARQTRAISGWGSVLEVGPEPSRAQTGGRLVPALAADVEQRAVQLLRNRETWPEALRVVTRGLAAAGLIDTTLIEGGEPTVDYMTNGEGRTQPTAPYDYAGRNVCRVTAGSGAFRSVSLLASTLVHEFRHVLQHQHGPSASTVYADTAIDRGQPGKDAADVEAYATELDRAADTGMNQHPGQIADVWNRIHAAWQRLRPEARAPLVATYSRAYTTARGILRGNVALSADVPAVEAGARAGRPGRP